MCLKKTQVKETKEKVGCNIQRFNYRVWLEDNYIQISGGIFGGCETKRKRINSQNRRTRQGKSWGVFGRNNILLALGETQEEELITRNQAAASGRDLDINQPGDWISARASAISRRSHLPSKEQTTLNSTQNQSARYVKAVNLQIKQITQ